MVFIWLIFFAQGFTFLYRDHYFAHHCIGIESKYISLQNMCTSSVEYPHLLVSNSHLIASLEDDFPRSNSNIK